MESTTIVGEDAWLQVITDTIKDASDLEQRVAVVELYKEALSAEPWSCRLWLGYAEWVWSIYEHSLQTEASWPEEERLLAQELFSQATALEAWQEAAGATKFRINDSNEIWDRWIGHEIERLATDLEESSARHVFDLFLERLQIPHATWEQTSQKFSTFISKHFESLWEETMIKVTSAAQDCKSWYAAREDFETRLRQGSEARDDEAEAVIMQQYLDWETKQVFARGKKTSSKSPLIMSVALYERALCSTALGKSATSWEDYMAFLSLPGIKDDPEAARSLVDVAQRAAMHCPWSGALWARYIDSADAEGQTYAEIQQIKENAVQSPLLDRDGLEAVMDVHSSWCAYLKRLAGREETGEVEMTLVDSELPAAIDAVRAWAQRLYGKDFTHDPLFRLEHIYIQYCTEHEMREKAEELWRKLLKTVGHSFEVWLQYYHWEVSFRDPSDPSSQASSILGQALRLKNLDWPEKIMEVYLRHCRGHASASALLEAKNLVHSKMKGIMKRRQREAADAAAVTAAATGDSNHGAADTALANEASPNSTKRKRQMSDEDETHATAKKSRMVDPKEDVSISQEPQLKRDRENTTILVTGLPVEISKLKLRQLFKDYGEINNVTLNSESDKQSTSALVEFKLPEDVQSALLCDGKIIDKHMIHVTSGTGLTLYVTNYPPTADEAYIRTLFAQCGEIFSIRFPSLKFNTQRRFCYVSFKDAAAAAEATRMDGKKLEGRFKLVAKYSDPPARKNREGATAEGRELHVSGIDPSLGESDLETVFRKYGKVERVNLLRTTNGASKGAAFISYESKGEAEAALELDKTKLKAKILHVEIAASKNFKPVLTTVQQPAAASASNGDQPVPATDSITVLNDANAPNKDCIITLLNVPDTVNNARIRAIAEPYGQVSRVTLRPDHQGAIVEYTDVKSAGKASLALDKHEIAPGRLLRIGGLKDLWTQTSEHKTEKIQIGRGKQEGTKHIQQTPFISRPTARASLGKKRGLGFVASGSNRRKEATSPADIGETTVQADGAAKAKSNADFRAMLNEGKSAGPHV